MRPDPDRLRIAVAARLLPLLLLLASCPPGPGCNLEQLAQVPLELANHVFVVPVMINGRAIEMMLDTGLQKTLLSEAAAQRLNLPRDTRSSTSLFGMNGSSATPDARIDSISIGGLALSVDRLPVNSFGGNQPFDGILGLDILHTYDLDIDGPGRRLTFYRARWCDPAVPPWRDQATPVAGVTTRAGWLKLPFKVDGVEGIAFLDTGTSNTVITPAMARRVGLTEQALMNDRVINLHVVAGDDTPSHLHWFDTVQIGPVVRHHTYVFVIAKEPRPIDNSSSFGDGIIGVDILGGQRLWLSIGTGSLYLQRRDGD